MTHLRAVDVQNDLCALILSDYADHRAETARIRAEAQARSVERHPSRVALRNEAAAENLRRLHILAGPSPADRVAEWDARVIDLAERRGERDA